jgi:hypothetical protein
MLLVCARRTLGVAERRSVLFCQMGKPSDSNQSTSGVEAPLLFLVNCSLRSVSFDISDGQLEALLDSLKDIIEEGAAIVS